MTTGLIMKQGNQSNENQNHQPLKVSLQLSGSDSEALSSSDDIHEEFSASAK